MKQRHDATDGRASAGMRVAGEAGHFRKGAAGGWREHFSPGQRDEFERVLRERLSGSGISGLYTDFRYK
jgi:hypothetical protein